MRLPQHREELWVGSAPLLVSIESGQSDPREEVNHHQFQLLVPGLFSPSPARPGSSRNYS
jgi:hypothetical protein